MSCNDKEILHVGDYGTQFLLTIKKTVNGVPTIVDISGATSLHILFRDSNGDVSRKTASLYTDGMDGIVTYTTVDGDIVVAGTMKYRAEVILSPTQKYQSSTCEIEVYEEWEVVS